VVDFTEFGTIISTIEAPAGKIVELSTG